MRYHLTASYCITRQQQMDFQDQTDLARWEGEGGAAAAHVATLAGCAKYMKGDRSGWKASGRAINDARVEIPQLVENAAG